MTRKQFIALIGVLVLLLGAGAWVKISDDAQWKATDERVGKLLPAGAEDVAGVGAGRLGLGLGTLGIGQIRDLLAAVGAKVRALGQRHQTLRAGVLGQEPRNLARVAALGVPLDAFLQPAVILGEVVLLGLPRRGVGIVGVGLGPLGSIGDQGADERLDIDAAAVLGLVADHEACILGCLRHVVDAATCVTLLFLQQARNLAEVARAQVARLT